VQPLEPESAGNSAAESAPAPAPAPAPARAHARARRLRAPRLRPPPARSSQGSRKLRPAGARRLPISALQYSMIPRGTATCWGRLCAHPPEAAGVLSSKMIIEQAGFGKRTDSTAKKGQTTYKMSIFLKRKWPTDMLNFPTGSALQTPHTSIWTLTPKGMNIGGRSSIALCIAVKHAQRVHPWPRNSVIIKNSLV
jgi:hypothetical protein